MTSQERLNFYRKLIIEVDSCMLMGRYHVGMCYLIKHRLDGPYVYDHDIFKKELPELWALKTKRTEDSYWWSLTKRGLACRRKAIEKCIKMLQQ